MQQKWRSANAMRARRRKRETRGKASVAREMRAACPSPKRATIMPRQVKCKAVVRETSEVVVWRGVTPTLGAQAVRGGAAEERAAYVRCALIDREER